MSIFDYILDVVNDVLHKTETYHVRGHVCQVTGTIVQAGMPELQIGERCILHTPSTGLKLDAEVVGFNNDIALLSPIGGIQGISTETEVIPTGQVQQAPVGHSLLGRVIDGMGLPLDGKGPIYTDSYYPIHCAAPQPMKRLPITQVLPIGVRAIDSLLTMCLGQRIGVFAGAGIGKSKLLSMIIRGTAADVLVLNLIGERGREVREFIEVDIGYEYLKRSVVVCSTSDRSPMERSKSLHVGMAIAEFFRDQGKKVLLLVDSLTRYARAHREIWLAAGEPPARRAYPPSVFTMLPKILERAGNNDKGSISMVSTVLVEGDDVSSDPIADDVVSLLDGHIILDRKTAATRYPAISIPQSVSRLMDSVVDKEHVYAAREVRKLLDKYSDVEFLIKTGEYKPGTDSETDEAVKKHPIIEKFLQQNCDELAMDYNLTIKQLQDLVS